MPSDGTSPEAVAADPPIDGRRARRERSRAAIIDAVFALVQDGKIPPTVEDVAERAGVSVSSVFRNFDGLDDMQRQAFDRFQERFRHLLEPAHSDTDLEAADRSARIAGHVRSRVELYSAAGPLMHIARQRALDYQPMAEGVARMRLMLADQTRRAYAPETERLAPTGAANLIALIDATTSPEAFEVMGAVHARSPRQITDTWTTALSTLINGWPQLSNTPEVPA